MDGTVLIPSVLGALWTSDQASAQGFVVQPAIAELTLDVYDAYVAEDLLKDFAQQTDPQVIDFMANYIVALESKIGPKDIEERFLEDVAPAASFRLILIRFHLQS